MQLWQLEADFLYFLKLDLCRDHNTSRTRIPENVFNVGFKQRWVGGDRDGAQTQHGIIRQCPLLAIFRKNC